MKPIATTLLTLLACWVVSSDDTCRTFRKTAAVTLGVLVTLWLCHGAGLWPFK